jgi:hypothetical protein
VRFSPRRLRWGLQASESVFTPPLHRLYFFPAAFVDVRDVLIRVVDRLLNRLARRMLVDLHRWLWRLRGDLPTG